MHPGTVIEVVLATIKGMISRPKSSANLSAYVLQEAILQTYVKMKMFPEGLSPSIPSVRDWALRCGAIVKKLVHGFKFSLCFLFMFEKQLKDHQHEKDKRIQSSTYCWSTKFCLGRTIPEVDQEGCWGQGQTSSAHETDGF